MRELFLKHITRTSLFEPAHRVLLAVSGGLDSMVMLHLFHSNHFNFGVAHCNFQLRGAESDGDEQFIKQFCEAHHIPFFFHRFDTNNYATENQVSIQMAARDLRYAWFEEIRTRERFDFIATAHHLSDSVETVIFNLVNGRGADGLTGIEAKAGKIIRPLLFANRDEINQYAAANEIVWREDESNFTSDYKRNFIRHEIMPRLQSLNPNVERAIARSISKTSGILEFNDIGRKEFDSKYVERKQGRVSILKSGLSAFHSPESVLYQFIREFNFSIDQCTQVGEVLNGQPGKTFFSSTHQLVVDRDQLIISPLTDPVQSIRIESGSNTAILGDIELEIESVTSFAFADEYVLLDAEKIKFPLTWRPWREGDFFYPLGMSHKKKVSDFLIDIKTPLSDKSRITVLESGGEIAWLVGHRISEHFKITESTSRALRLTLRPYFI